MRRSRHRAPATKPDFEIRATPRALATLGLFDRYRILPLNWMYALADRGGYTGYRDLCTRLCHAGLLQRKTLNGSTNNNETMSFTRSDAGTRFLHRHGFKVLHNDTRTDAHQALIDISEAQIELGARDHAIEYHPWLDVRDHPLTPKLPERPFRFDIGDSYQLPDGRPFYLKNGAGQSALFLREIDRNTESDTTIRIKLQNYKVIHDHIKQRYGFKQALLLFITTTERQQENVHCLIREVFAEGCKWILTNTMRDHVRDCLSTLPVATELFTTPYRRVGYAPFSLKILADMP